MEYNTSVIVPDLGCFSIVDKPAEFQEGKLIPPVKTVQLDSENTNDDRLFILYVANKEKVTLEQAAQEIKRFYHQNFIKKLSNSGIVTIDDFGTFTLDDSGYIVFEPDANFFKDNFGLDSAYIPGNIQQPAVNPVVPEPIPVFVYEPVQSPQPIQPPEPVQPPQPVQPPEPVQPTQPVQPPEPEIKETQNNRNDPNESLFDTGNKANYKENTNRRVPNYERQKPPAKPTPKPVPKKSKTKVKSKSPYLWLLLILLATAGISVAGYYFYPVIYPMLFAPVRTTVVTIVDEDDDTNPVDAYEMDESMPNTGIAQTLDEATDIKNALNPENSQQSTASTSQTQASQPVETSSTPTTATSTSTTPTSATSTTSTSSTSTTSTRPENVTSLQSNTGRGKYLLVVSSLSTRSAAESHVKKLQAEGYNCEIVDAGEQRFRVSVASFDNLAEATRQANQMKSMPYCEGVWVVRR